MKLESEMWNPFQWCLLKKTCCLIKTGNCSKVGRHDIQQNGLHDFFIVLLGAAIWNTARINVIVVRGIQPKVAGPSIWRFYPVGYLTHLTTPPLVTRTLCSLPHNILGSGKPRSDVSSMFISMHHLVPKCISCTTDIESLEKPSFHLILDSCKG